MELRIALYRSHSNSRVASASRSRWNKGKVENAYINLGEKEFRGRAVEPRRGTFTFDPWMLEHRRNESNKSELFSCRVGGGCVTYSTRVFAHADACCACVHVWIRAHDIFSRRDRHDERISRVEAVPCNMRVTRLYAP